MEEDQKKLIAELEITAKAVSMYSSLIMLCEKHKLELPEEAKEFRAFYWGSGDKQK